MSKLTENDYIFDGFCERRFNPEYDGYLNELPDEKYYPAVRAARETIALFNELCKAREKIWRLEKELELYKPFHKI